MGRVHEVGIAADAKAFDQGIRSGVIKPLEAADDALKDLGKNRGPEELERDLKDAQKQTKELASETKDTARQIERSYKEAGQDIKKGVGDGLKDAKQEAGQAGREGAASFSGEFSDVGDFIQETAANAFGGFGPLGAAAGVAAALGIGVLTAEITKQQEEADELKARLSDAYRTAAEEGRNYLDTAQMIAEVSDLMFNEDRAEEWKRVQEDAKQLGLEAFDVAEARAGSTDKQRDIQERVNALLADENNYTTTLREGQHLLNDDVADLAKRWGTVITETEKQQQRAEQLAEYTNRAEEENRTQIKRTQDAAQARYDGLAEKYRNPIMLKVGVDTSGADRQLDMFRTRAAQGVKVPIIGQPMRWE
jgi:hypothetical protein